MKLLDQRGGAGWSIAEYSRCKSKVQRLGGAISRGAGTELVLSR